MPAVSCPLYPAAASLDATMRRPLHHHALFRALVRSGTVCVLGELAWSSSSREMRVLGRLWRSITETPPLRSMTVAMLS